MTKHPLKSQKEPLRTVIEGDLTVERAVDLKKALMDAIAHAQSTVICLKNIKKTDISFLQLVHAAHLTAIDNGKELCLDRRLPENFIESVRLAGYTHHHFWAEHIEHAPTHGGKNE